LNPKQVKLGGKTSVELKLPPFTDFGHLHLRKLYIVEYLDSENPAIHRFHLSKMCRGPQNPSKDSKGHQVHREIQIGHLLKPPPKLLEIWNMI